MICHDCGAQCGKQHKISLREEEYVCDKCYKKREDNKFKVFVGIVYLGFSAVVTGVFSGLILIPLIDIFGATTVRIIGAVVAITCLALFLIVRKKVDKTRGCLARVFLKICKILLFALGAGLLYTVCFMGELFQPENGGKSVEPGNSVETTP